MHDLSKRLQTAMPFSSTFHETKSLLSRDYPVGQTTNESEKSLSTHDILKINKQQRLLKLKEATNIIEEEYKKLIIEEFPTSASPSKEA